MKPKQKVYFVENGRSDVGVVVRETPGGVIVKFPGQEPEEFDYKDIGTFDDDE